MLDKFEVLRNAETYVVNRQFGRAIKEYRSLLESKGEDPALLNTLGDLLLKNKKQPEALEHFRRVAQIFIESGFTNKAIAVCKKIYKLDPSDRNTMGQLADLYVKRGFQSQAVKYYKQLVADSRDAGEFPEAVDWQRQLLKAYPGQPEPFAELAELNLKLEDTEGAQGNFVTAAWLSFNKGDYQESVDYAEQALTLDEQSEAALRLKEVASRVVVDGESVLADPALQLDADMFATATAFQSDEPEAVPLAPAEATVEEPSAEPEPIQVGQDASGSAAESEEDGSATKETVEDYSAVGELGGETDEDQPASDTEIPDELVAVVEDSESEPEAEMVHELSDDIIDNDLQDVEELFKDAAEARTDSEEYPEDFGMVEGEPLGELDSRVVGSVDSLERFGEVLGADEAVEAPSEPEEEEASKQLSETQVEHSTETDEIADTSIEISVEPEQQSEGVESFAAEEEAAGEPVAEDRTEGLVGADEYFQDQASAETSDEPDTEQTLSAEVDDSQELAYVAEEEPAVSDVVEIPEDIGTLEEPLAELVGDGEVVASPGADQDEEIFDLSVGESAEEVLERLETVPFESEAPGSEGEIAVDDLQDDGSVLEIADDFSSEGLSSVSVEELFEEAVSAEETSELAEDSLEPTLELDAEPEETLLAEGQSDEGLAAVAGDGLEQEKAESEEPRSFWDKLRNTVLGESPEADEDEGVVETLEQAAEVAEANECTGEEVVEERGDEEELRSETLEAAESEQIEEVESEFETEEWVESLSDEEVDEELESVEVSESEVEEVAQAVDEEVEPIEVEALEESGDPAPEEAGEPEETVELEAVDAAEDRVDEILETGGVEEEAEKSEMVALEESEEAVSVEEGTSDGQLDLAAEESGETAEEEEWAAEDRVDEILEAEGVEEELTSLEVSENLAAEPTEEEALSKEKPEPEAWEVFWADTDSESNETHWTEEQRVEESEFHALEDQPEAKSEPVEAATAKVSEKTTSLWDKLRDTVMGSSNEVDEEAAYTEVSDEVVEAVELSESEGTAETQVDEEELSLGALEPDEAEQVEEPEEVFGAASQQEVVAEPEVAGVAEEFDGGPETEGVDEETEEPEIAASEEGEEAVSKEDEEPDEQIDLAAEEREEAAEAEEWVAEEEVEVEAEDLVEAAADEQSEQSGASLAGEGSGEELEPVEGAESDVEELGEVAEEAESMEVAAPEESGEAVPEESREPEAVVELGGDGKEEPRYEINDLWNRLLKKTLGQDEPEVAVESEAVETEEDEIDEILEAEGIDEETEEPELTASEQSDDSESTDQISEELSVDEESQEERELVAEEDSHDDLKPVGESAVEDSPKVETLAEESDAEAPALLDSEKKESRDYGVTITEGWKQPSVYADSSPSLAHEETASHDSPASTWHAASEGGGNGDGKKDLGSIDEALQEYDFNMKLGLREEAERLISQLLAEHSSDEKVRLRAKSHGITLPSTEQESAPEAEVEGDTTLEDEFESAFEDIFNMPGDEILEDVLVYELDTAETTPSDESKVQFDLGLGYREMGLLDDAIEKFEEAFQVAIDSSDEAHAANCCGMLASTYRELTDYRKVLEWADRGLGLHVAKAFEEKALQYERAQALEMLGDFRQSLDTYRTLMEQDPAFRDVRARVGRLNLLSN